MHEGREKRDVEDTQGRHYGEYNLYYLYCILMQCPNFLSLLCTHLVPKTFHTYTSMNEIQFEIRF